MALVWSFGAQLPATGVKFSWKPPYMTFESITMCWMCFQVWLTELWLFTLLLFLTFAQMRIEFLTTHIPFNKSSWNVVSRQASAHRCLFMLWIIFYLLFFQGNKFKIRVEFASGVKHFIVFPCNTANVLG